LDKGIIIHLDDDEKILSRSKRSFEENGLNTDFEFITCNTNENFDREIKKNKENLKCIIFDFLGYSPGTEEFDQGKARFLEEITSSHAQFNIPIFIFSGITEKIPVQIREHSTVFILDKAQSVNNIFDKIKLFHESGFLEVFCHGGVLEKQIHMDLHKAFTEQFTNGEQLEKTIKSIKISVKPEEFKKQTKKIFQRIAIRSLMSGLLAPVTNAKGEIIEEHLSSTEHYVKRINNINIWTGDVFKKNSSDDYIFILTPRCNIAKCESILCCPLKLGEFPTKGDDPIKALHGDPQVSGYDVLLPPSPIFNGGKVLISKFDMIAKTNITNNYKRIISMSDELSNEILGRFGSYFFRTGITPWNEEEIKKIVQANQGKPIVKK
jgi:hypothetical protein